MSRYSYESPLRTSTSGFTSKYSTIEYLQKFQCGKSANHRTISFGFSPTMKHIAISNSATVASRPSRPCLGSRKISWIFGSSNLFMDCLPERASKFHEFQMLLSSEKIVGKIIYQCDISTGNMFTFQANRIGCGLSRQPKGLSRQL